MKKMLLSSEIQKIQEDYLALLKSMDLESITQDVFLNCIDTLEIFWHSRRESIDLFLYYHLADTSTYLHTGNGSFSLEEGIHYAFVTLGDLHIIDDPVTRLSTNVKFMPEGEFKENIIRKIKKRASDIILLIEQYTDIFIVLPVTICTGKELQKVFGESENIFFTMFKDESLTREKYFKNFTTLDEVEAALKDHIPRTLIFSDEDDLSIDMKERFRCFLKTQNNPFAGTSFSEAQAFIGIVTSYFTQALTISMMSLSLKTTPFIQYFLPFMYFRMIMENFIKDPIAEQIILKATYAYLLIRHLDDTSITTIDFKDYYTKAVDFDFEKHLLNRLKAKDTTPFSQIPISELMKDIVETGTNFSARFGPEFATPRE